MRKIKIKTAQNNLRKNVAIIFLVLLTFSTVGYSIVNSFSNPSNKESNPEGFEREGNYWATEFANQKYYFSYLPSQLENITIEGNFSLNDYYSVPLYFTKDGERVLEILNNLQRYVEKSQMACLGNCNENLPIKNCSMDNLIIFQEGINSVRKINNCVYLSGDQLKTADKFLYEVLKIN